MLLMVLERFLPVLTLDDRSSVISLSIFGYLWQRQLFESGKCHQRCINPSICMSHFTAHGADDQSTRRFVLDCMKQFISYGQWRSQMYAILNDWRFLLQVVLRRDNDFWNCWSCQRPKYGSDIRQASQKPALHMQGIGITYQNKYQSQCAISKADPRKTVRNLKRCSRRPDPDIWGSLHHIMQYWGRLREFEGTSRAKIQVLKSLTLECRFFRVTPSIAHNKSHDLLHKSTPISRY